MKKHIIMLFNMAFLIFMSYNSALSMTEWGLFDSESLQPTTLKEWKKAFRDSHAFDDFVDLSDVSEEILQFHPLQDTTLDLSNLNLRSIGKPAWLDRLDLSEIKVINLNNNNLDSFRTARWLWDLPNLTKVTFTGLRGLGQAEDELAFLQEELGKKFEIDTNSSFSLGGLSSTWDTIVDSAKKEQAERLEKARGFLETIAKERAQELERARAFLSEMQ